MIAPTYFHDGRATLYGGDCLEVLKQIADNSIDAVCTDPPYHLTSIVKRFGAENAAPAMSAAQRRFAKTGGADRKPGPDQYGRLSRGFMGKQWDGGDIAFRVELWAECWRVLKPGGHVAAFAAPKNRDLMSTAIRAAGFEVRDEIVDLFSLDDNERRFVESLSPDQSELLARCLDHASDFGMLAWLFGSGFPKSHDISKAIDRALGAERAVVSQGAPVKRMIPGADQHKDGWEKTSGRIYVPTETAPATEEAAQWEGWGTALKPAIEPICLARKPLSEKTVAANVLRWGVGAINVDACRVGYADESDAAAAAAAAAKQRSRQTDRNVDGWGMKAQDISREDYLAGSAGLGRWPANLVHDGSPEVVAGFPESSGAQGKVAGGEPSETGQNGIYGRFARVPSLPPRGDSGSAARFFYSSKAGGDDRLGSKHPTVKPVDLMRWLVRLVTPPGGTVLDPFAGTGTTGHAALLEGFKAIMIEREAEYQADIARRMGLVFAGETERAHAIVKARGEEEAHYTLPLFGGA